MTVSGRGGWGASARHEPDVDLEAAVAAFAEQGYVRVEGLVSADEVARFRPLVDAAVARRTAHDTRTLDEKSRYEQSFQQCLNIWEDVPEVRGLTFHPGIARTAAALLGVEGVRVWHDQALYKEAGGPGTDAHLDQAYWPIAETDTVTAWIPFVDVTEASGAMGYVPGSHAFGERQFANIFFGEGFDLAEGPEARGVPPVYVEPRAGDVVFHHGMTIHTARPNTSDQVRAVHTVIFFADGSTRSVAPNFPHPSVDRDGIEPGQPIDGPVTPVAWPRPDGDLPGDPPPFDPPSPGWPGWNADVS